jgi:ParB-like chromosome segregation protein Spo0J
MPSQSKVKISELQVNQEYENLLPLLLDEDLKNLEKSILKDGVLHPFIINPDKVVLDGHHRLIICQRHSINEVPVIEHSFKTGLEEKEFVISFNLNRRHLTTTQKVELALTILKIEMEKARRRQLSQLMHVKDSIVVPNSEQRDVEHGKAIEIAAKKVGLGKDTLWKGKQILDAAEKDPEVYKAWQGLAQGERSINSIHQDLFHKEEEEPPIQINPKIEGVFQVIVIDPPNFNLEKLKRTTIPFDDKQCVIWLWTPIKSLCEAFQFLHSLGFQVQTMLTWVKNKRSSGNWLLNQTEHCILATRGKPSVNLTSQSTALIAASSEHNSKPDEFYSLVDSLCDGRKLGMFCKINRPNYELIEPDANVI